MPGGGGNNFFNVRIIKMLLQCTLHNSGLNYVSKITEILMREWQQHLLFVSLPGCQLTFKHATTTLRRPLRKKY